MTFPAAPRDVVDPEGAPALGRFQGRAASFDWARLAAPYARGPMWRRFHHKRWHYAALATPEVFCAAAVVDVGWTNTAFCYVFDRSERRVVAAFSRDGVPGLTASVAHAADGVSTFVFGGHGPLPAPPRAPAARPSPRGQRITLSPSGLQVAAQGLAIDAQFGGTAPLLLAVGQPQGGSVHATQKSGGLALTGSVSVASRTYSLDGGTASFDYSNGLLGRDTAWRWASAHGRDLGFNLQAGYFGANENALWLGGQIYPLAEARFDYDPINPLAPWHVSTADGLLDLVFTPEGARREDRNLIVAATRYVQPIGVFDGWVRAHADAAPVRVERLVGVTEDHSSRW